VAKQVANSQLSSAQLNLGTHLEHSSAAKTRHQLRLSLIDRDRWPIDHSHALHLPIRVALLWPEEVGP